MSRGRSLRPLPPIRPVRTQDVELTEWKQAGTAIGEIKPRYESEIGFRIAGKGSRSSCRDRDSGREGHAHRQAGKHQRANGDRIAETESGVPGPSWTTPVGKRLGSVSCFGAGTPPRSITMRLNDVSSWRMPSSSRPSWQERTPSIGSATPNCGPTMPASSPRSGAAGAGRRRRADGRPHRPDRRKGGRVQELPSIPCAACRGIASSRFLCSDDPSIQSIGHVREVATTADPRHTNFRGPRRARNSARSYAIRGHVQGRVGSRRSRS